MLRCLICAVFVQTATAQVFSHIPRTAPGQLITNQPMQISNANVNTLQGIPNGLQRTGNSNVLNGMPYMTNNMPNAPIPNVMNEQIINPNVGGIIANAEPTNSNIGGVNMETLANMANVNGNMATFNLGNGGFTVTSGSPGIPGFGIQVLADALEIGGRVAVNGQIPIYGAVTVNGQLPTDGHASVNYNCGGHPADVVLN